MASKVCKCGEDSYKNLGTNKCLPDYGITQKLGLTPILNNNGAKNFIDGSKEINQACIDDLFQNIDPSQRAFLTPGVENFATEREDDIFETFDSGKKCFVRNGIKSVTMEIPTNAHYEMARKINSIGCSEVGTYEISDCGAIRGLEDGGNLYPYKVDNLKAIPVDKTGSSCSKVLVSYDINLAGVDNYIGHIYSDSITGDLTGARALIELTPVEITVAATMDSFTFKLATCYGSVGQKVNYEGLVLSDATAFVNATGAVDQLPGLTITETAPGCYEGTIAPVPATTDVLTLTLDNLLVKGYAAQKVVLVMP